ncbi:hypothetical protein V8E36_003756 [Tilletia maclaganii]
MARSADVFGPSIPLLVRATILCLQECRLSQPLGWDEVHQLARLAAPHRLDSRRAIIGHDAGILVDASRFDLVDSDSGDRWVYARLLARAPLFEHAPSLRTFHVWSIHGPFEEQFWINDAPGLRRLVGMDLDTSVVLVGADWNSVPDPRLDDIRGGSERVRWQAIQPHLDHLRLFDAARWLHPDTLLASRTRTVRAARTTDRQTSARRIDSVWISTIARPAVREYVAAVTRSDHDAVDLRLGPASKPVIRSRPAQQWKLHPWVPLDPEGYYRLRTWAEEINGIEPLGGQPFRWDSWATYKDRLRVYCLEISRLIGARRLALLEDLPRLQTLIDELPLTDMVDADRRAEVATDLRLALDARDMWDRMRTQGSVPARLAKDSGWWADRALPATHAPMPALRLPGGAMSATNADKTAEVHRFFSLLFREDGSDPRRPSATRTLLASFRRRSQLWISHSQRPSSRLPSHAPQSYPPPAQMGSPTPSTWPRRRPQSPA